MRLQHKKPALRYSWPMDMTLCGQHFVLPAIAWKTLRVSHIPTGPTSVVTDFTYFMRGIV